MSCHTHQGVPVLSFAAMEAQILYAAPSHLVYIIISGYRQYDASPRWGAWWARRWESRWGPRWAPAVAVTSAGHHTPCVTPPFRDASDSEQKLLIPGLTMDAAPCGCSAVHDGQRLWTRDRTPVGKSVGVAVGASVGAGVGEGVGKAVGAGEGLPVGAAGGGGQRIAGGERGVRHDGVAFGVS
jgi:hypothetical protein